MTAPDGAAENHWTKEVRRLSLALSRALRSWFSWTQGSLRSPWAMVPAPLQG